MAHSIESRVPLLDHEVVTFAAALPSHLKIGGARAQTGAQEGRRRGSFRLRCLPGGNKGSVPDRRRGSAGRLRALMQRHPAVTARPSTRLLPAPIRRSAGCRTPVRSAGAHVADVAASDVRALASAIPRSPMRRQSCGSIQFHTTAALSAKRQHLAVGRCRPATAYLPNCSGTALLYPAAVPRGRPYPIVFLLTSFDVGGTERQMVELMRRLDRGRFDVHVACFHRRGPLESLVAGTRDVDRDVSDWRLRPGPTARQALAFADGAAASARASFIPASSTRTSSACLRRRSLASTCASAIGARS